MQCVLPHLGFQGSWRKWSQTWPEETFLPRGGLGSAGLWNFLSVNSDVSVGLVSSVKPPRGATHSKLSGPVVRVKIIPLLEVTFTFKSRPSGTVCKHVCCPARWWRVQVPESGSLGSGPGRDLEAVHLI